MFPKTIYYFGNPYIAEDNLAIKVAKSIEKYFPKIEFKHISSTFDLIDLDLSDSLLLDVADIPKVALIDSSKALPGGFSSAHDFDIGFVLTITQKPTKIIAIPKNYDRDKAIEEVREIISSSNV